MPERTFELPVYLRSLIDAIQDGFVIRALDGTIVEVNRAFLDLVGYERDEVIGERAPHDWWIDSSGSEELSAIGDRYIRGSATGDRVNYRRKDGAVFPALVTSNPLRDEHGTVVGYIGTFKDISAWSTVEQRLWFQAQLLDQVQAAVIATDPGGKVLLWSTGAETLFGYPRQEMFGRDLKRLLVEATGHKRAQAILATLSAHEPWEGELDVPRRDGGRLPVLAAVSSLYVDTGELAGFVVVSVDLRERKRTESRIAAQYEAAQVLASSDSLSDGLHAVIETVGQRIDWQAGLFWSPDAVTEALQCIDVWSAPGIEIADFELDSRRGLAQDDLPGRVWRLREPVWIDDLVRDPAFMRTESAAAAGLRTAIAFPVEAEGRLIGVMELFSQEAEPRDDSLIAMLMTIGRQVGQFVERRKALASLRESEGRFRMMAESVPVMLWLTSPSGHVEYLNRVWRDFTGRPAEQDLGDGWLENLHPDDQPIVAVAYRQAFETQTPYEIEFRLRRYDGEYRWVLATGMPRYDSDGVFRGYTGSCLDIDERRRHEEQQRFLSDATRDLASSLDVHKTLNSVARLAVPTFAEWCVVYRTDAAGNLQCEAMAPAVLDGAGVEECDRQRFVFAEALEVAAADAARMQQPRICTLVGEGFQHILDVSGPGTEQSAMAMIFPIIARDRALGVIAFGTNPHGHHFDEADLAVAQHLARRAAVAIDNARLYQEAQESARARDQFLAVAAHELRSPLTSMKGFAQLLLRRANRSDAGVEWLSPLETIDTQVNRMAELVNRLLDVSRIEEKRLQLVLGPADLRQIVTNAVFEARMTTENHVVRYIGVDEPVEMALDATRVTQVMSNLLDNAIRYSPPDTTVAVDLQSDEESAVVSVRDEGPGVPDHLRQRLFERYFSGSSSLRNSSEGLGLGLYVASGIVEAHGGIIWVDSDGENGATFNVRFPRMALPPAEEEA